MPEDHALRLARRIEHAGRTSTLRYDYTWDAGRLALIGCNRNASRCTAPGFPARSFLAARALLAAPGTRPLDALALDQEPLVESSPA